MAVEVQKKNIRDTSNSNSNSKHGRKTESNEELEVNPDNIVCGKRRRVDINYVALNEEVSLDYCLLSHTHTL